MSISYGLNLGIMNGAADGDLYGNAMRAFQRACDAFLQPIVKGYLTNTPPGSPVDGDMYIVGSAPTGSWASYAGYVAKWSSLLAAWEFYLPKNGWQFQSNSARESYRYTGSAWEIYYQEGTWTPTLGAGWTNSGTPSIAGKFRKVGSIFSVKVKVGGANHGGTGTISCVQGAAIAGIPVWASDDFVTYASNSIGGPNYGTSTGGGTDLYVPAMPANSDQINIFAMFFI